MCKIGRTGQGSSGHGRIWTDMDMDGLGRRKSCLCKAVYKAILVYFVRRSAAG